MLFLFSSFAMEGPAPDEPVAPEAMEFRGELAGRGAVILSGALYPRFTLSRARATARWRGPLGASARVVTIVGPPDGPLVFNVQLAEARMDVPNTGLSIAAGQIDDLWTGTHQPAWGIPEVAIIPSLSSGFMPRADLGAWMSWTSSGHRFSGSVSATRGFVDDRATDVSVLLTGRLVDTSLGTLTAHAFARLAQQAGARNDRVGGTLRLDTSAVTTAGSVLVGRGNGLGQAESPWLVTGHVRTAKTLPWVGWVRGDLTWLSGLQGEANRQLLAGAGPKLPVRADGPVWVGLLYQLSDFGTPIPPLTERVVRHSLGLQLSTDLTMSLPL